MARKTDVDQETNQIKEKQKEKGGRDATRQLVASNESSAII